MEGRSTNPVSILFDALSHPDADLGDDKPSLLNWQYRQDLKVDHVVLGKGCPGGAWKVKFKWHKKILRIFSADGATSYLLPYFPILRSLCSFI